VRGRWGFRTPTPSHPRIRIRSALQPRCQEQYNTLSVAQVERHQIQRTRGLCVFVIHPSRYTDSASCSSWVVPQLAPGSMGQPAASTFPKTRSVPYDALSLDVPAVWRHLQRSRGKSQDFTIYPHRRATPPPARLSTVMSPTVPNSTISHILCTGSGQFSLTRTSLCMYHPLGDRVGGWGGMRPR
jgi:hypothetical protein